MPSRYCQSFCRKSNIGRFCAGGCSGSGRKMPFGRPVVPDEYSIAVPADSSGIGVFGSPEVAACNPTMHSLSLGPSATIQSSTLGQSLSAWRATSSLATEVMRMREQLLLTM